MPFSDSLADKLAELREAALVHFEAYELSGISGHLGHVSDDGTRVIVTMPGLTDDEGVLQGRLDQLLSDLGVLETRVNRYAELDSADLERLRGSLCPGEATSLGLGDWGVSSGSPASTSRSPNYPVQRLDYAAHLVTEAADPHNAIWKGRAAEAFNRNFLRRFEAVADQQVFCGVYLADVLQVFYNATEATAQDVLAIIDAGIQAFTGEGSDGIAAALSLTSLLTTLIGFFPGASVPAGGVSVVLWGLSQGVEEPPPPEWHVDVASNYTPEIIWSIHDELIRLEERLVELDDELFNALDQDFDHFFDPSRTRLRDAGPDPEDQIDPPDRIAELVDADVEAIYLMGWYTFPMAADHYRKAAEKVDECNVPNWFRTLVLPRSKFRFEFGRLSLGTSLDLTEDQLEGAGDALVDVADAYDWEDAAAAAKFERYKDGIPEGRAFNTPAHLR